MTRTKAKYNPTPTARERKFHLYLMDAYPCACGCGKPSTVVHHPLERHPAQRWRRDHEYTVPMNHSCHSDLHALGRESLFSDKSFAELAHWYREQGIKADRL